MGKRSNLAELVRLSGIQKKKGFADREECLSWANRVAPLLQFNRQYYLTFVKAAHELSANLSGDALQARWRIMLNQLEMAISELRYEIDHVLCTPEPVKLTTSEGTYVSLSRIKELESIQNDNYDLQKLIEFLREINECHLTKCYLSIIMLVRAILDHVPPIFGFASFNEVASNYGSRSVKESMASLNRSARKIADQHLHSHIRSKETLPNVNQVDFSNDLDVLLCQIVVKLR